MNTPTYIIINTILSIIGLLLGYFYLPILVTRYNKKKEWERRRLEEEEITKSVSVGLTGNGHRAPNDNPPPNKGSV